MSKKRAARAQAYRMEDEFNIISSNATLDRDESKTVVQPIKFFGEPGEDIEKWLKSFDRVAKANNWSEKRQCDILPAYLRDRAAEYFDELPDRNKTTLAKLKEALIEHFMPKEARRFYYADLYSRKQGQYESASDFGRAIQLLVRRAYAEMPLEHQDTLMREHYVNGLRPDLKRIVLISDPQTFNNALDLAKREEINEQIASGSAPWVKARFESPSVATPVATVQKDPVNERLDRLEAAIEKLALTFAQNNNARDNTVRSSRNLRATDGRPICNFCKRVGHVEAKCFTKQKKEDKSSKN